MRISGVDQARGIVIGELHGACSRRRRDSNILTLYSGLRLHRSSIVLLRLTGHSWVLLLWRCSLYLGVAERIGSLSSLPRLVSWRSLLGWIHDNRLFLSTNLQQDRS